MEEQGQETLDIQLLQYIVLIFGDTKIKNIHEKSYICSITVVSFSLLAPLLVSFIFLRSPRPCGGLCSSVAYISFLLSSWNAVESVSLSYPFYSATNQIMSTRCVLSQDMSFCSQSQIEIIVLLLKYPFFLPLSREVPTFQSLSSVYLAFHKHFINRSTMSFNCLWLSRLFINCIHKSMFCFIEIYTIYTMFNC